MEFLTIPSETSGISRETKYLILLEKIIKEAEGSEILPKILKLIGSTTLFQVGIIKDANKLGILPEVLDSADYIAKLMYDTRENQAKRAERRIKEVKMIGNS